MGYTVIDLGADAIPADGSSYTIWRRSLGDSGDVILASASDTNALFLRLFDGTLVDLPPQIRHPFAVAATSGGDRLVIGAASGSDLGFIFNATTGAVTQVVLPNSFALSWANYINSMGDIIGWAYNGAIRTGFVFNWFDKSFVPLSPPFAMLSDMDDKRRAVGYESMHPGARAPWQVAYYDGIGANVTGLGLFTDHPGPRGGPLFRINNRKQIAAEIGPDAQTLQSNVLLYDVDKQEVIETFLNAKLHGISDLGEPPQVLWTSTLPSGGSYLAGTPVSLLFPRGSGLVKVTAVTDLNRNGMILGRGLFSGYFSLNPTDRYSERTFLLVPDGLEISTNVPALVATILVGIINDAPGFALKGRHIIPVGPDGPGDPGAILGELPAPLRRRLAGTIDRAQLDTPAAIQAFTREVMADFAHYYINRGAQGGLQ